MSALHCPGQHCTCPLPVMSYASIECYTCRAKDLQEQRKAESYVRRMAALGVPLPVPDRLANQQQQAPCQWQQAPASYVGVDVSSDAYTRQHMQGPPSTSGRPTYGAPNEALHWELPQVRRSGVSVWCCRLPAAAYPISIRKRAAAVLCWLPAAASRPSVHGQHTSAAVQAAWQTILCCIARVPKLQSPQPAAEGGS